MFQRDVHGVRHFAPVLPQIHAAHHVRRVRDLQSHRLVPEGQLMAHILVDVAARIIPEEAPVDVAVGVEIARRRLAQERLPDDVFRSHIGKDRPRPLRLAVRRVAVHVRVDGRDFADIAGLQKVDRVAHLTGRTSLVADLHGAPAGALVSRAHALGMLHAERHGLFLIDVFAGVERRHEVLAMQVLRRGDEDRVDALVVQQVAVVEIGLGGGRDGARVVQALSVDVRDAGEFRVGTCQRLAHELCAAIAGADDADANAVTRSQHVGRGDSAGQTASDFADEDPARLHEKLLREHTSRAGRRAIGAKDQDSTAAELGGPRYRTASCTMVRIVRLPIYSMARAKTRPNVPVFVSSTFTDMQAYRRKVRDALTQLEAVVRGMEQFESKQLFAVWSSSDRSPEAQWKSAYRLFSHVASMSESSECGTVAYPTATTSQ